MSKSNRPKAQIVLTKEGEPVSIQLNAPLTAADIIAALPPELQALTIFVEWPECTDGKRPLLKLGETYNLEIIGKGSRPSLYISAPKTSSGV